MTSPFTEAPFGSISEEGISKADERYDSAGRRAAVVAFNPIHGAIAGRPGKKIRAYGNEFVGGNVGSLGGAAPGLATMGAGMAAKKPGVVGAGLLMTAGGAAGGRAVGALQGHKRNLRRNYLSPLPSKKNVEKAMAPGNMIARAGKYVQHAALAGKMNGRAIGQDLAAGAKTRKTVGLMSTAKMSTPSTPLSVASRVGYRAPEIAGGTLLAGAGLGAGAAALHKAAMHPGLTTGMKALRPTGKWGDGTMRAARRSKSAINYYPAKPTARAYDEATHAYIGKAERHFDAEDNRQRRIGLASGVGYAGAVGAGGMAYDRLKGSGFIKLEDKALAQSKRGEKAIRRIAVTPEAVLRGRGRTGLALAGTSAALGLGGTAASAYGASKRNKRWN